jgi:DNA-binding response OmpR family regulator
VIKSKGKKIVIASRRLELADPITIYLENSGYKVELVGSYKEAISCVNCFNGEAFALFDGTIGADSIEMNLVDVVDLLGLDSFAVMTGDTERFKKLKNLGFKVLFKPFLANQLIELVHTMESLVYPRGKNDDLNNIVYIDERRFV